MKYNNQSNEKYSILSNKPSNPQLNLQSKYRQNSKISGSPLVTNISVPIPFNDPTLDKQRKSEQNNISSRSNSSNERRSQVYVHHYNKLTRKSSSNSQQNNNWKGGNEIHQNMYKHEFSDYYDAKINTLRKQFDNLSLKKSGPSNSPNKMPRSSYHCHRFTPSGKIDYYNHPSKFPYTKSNVSAKINRNMLLKPDHKAAMDKLEETYWAKWKPKKRQPSKESHHKMKGLYTENEKITAPLNIARRNVQDGKGDSSETIALSSTSSRKSQITDIASIYMENKEVPEQVEPVKDEPTVEKQSKEDIHQDEPGNSGEAIIEFTNPESDSESSISALKHTDSFILTAKKQNQNKPHYQQPKCIKLFKNADYSPTATINFIKGGTYPLKSCLKKETFSRSSHFGRPGSPIKVIARRPGKANRFIK